MLSTPVSCTLRHSLFLSVHRALRFRWQKQHVSRHVGQELIRNPLEHLRQFLAKLRHHGLQHFVSVLPQEEVRRLG